MISLQPLQHPSHLAPPPPHPPFASRPSKKPILQSASIQPHPSAESPLTPSIKTNPTDPPKHTNSHTLAFSVNRPVTPRLMILIKMTGKKSCRRIVPKNAVTPYWRRPAVGWNSGWRGRGCSRAEECVGCMAGGGWSPGWLSTMS